MRVKFRARRDFVEPSCRLTRDMTTSGSMRWFFYRSISRGIHAWEIGSNADGDRLRPLSEERLIEIVILLCSGEIGDEMTSWDGLKYSDRFESIHLNPCRCRRRLLIVYYTLHACESGTCTDRILKTLPIEQPYRLFRARSNIVCLISSWFCPDLIVYVVEIFFSKIFLAKSSRNIGGLGNRIFAKE